MPNPKQRVTRGTLAAQLEEALRAEIITGELPPGTRLRAEDVATRYGVSHTPIREALRSLAADSLISIDPRAGAQVATISLEDLNDVYRLRILLEREALRASMRGGGPGWKKDLQHATQRLEETFRRRAWGTRAERAEARATAHQAFDAALFSACGSQWLLRFVGVMSAHSERYRMALRAIRGVERDLAAEHVAITEAVLRDDAEAAVEALEYHLRTSLNMLQSHFVPSDGHTPPPDEADGPSHPPRSLPPLVPR